MSLLRNNIVTHVSVCPRKLHTRLGLIMLPFVTSQPSTTNRRPMHDHLARGPHPLKLVVRVNFEGLEDLFIDLTIST